MNRIFRNRRRSSKTRRGAAAVETALTMPVLIIITFGSIDVTQYMNLAQQVNNASREGARVASRATTDSVEDVENAVLDYMANAMQSIPRETLQSALDVVIRNESASQEVTNGQLSQIESGDPVSIEVGFDFSTIRWLTGPSYSNDNVSVRKTFCRRE